MEEQFGEYFGFIAIIRNDSRFPIYDQHVHRAMAHIQGWDNIEIPSSNKKKVDFRIGETISFIADYIAYLF